MSAICPLCGGKRVRGVCSNSLCAGSKGDAALSKGRLPAGHDYVAGGSGGDYVPGGSAGGDTPVVPGRFFRNAATFSWGAPIGAVVLRLVCVAQEAGSISQGEAPDPLLRMIFSMLCGGLILGGILAGFVALVGLFKHGTKGILIPALVGITINVFLIMMALTAVAEARSKLPPGPRRGALLAPLETDN